MADINGDVNIEINVVGLEQFNASIEGALEGINTLIDAVDVLREKLADMKVEIETKET